MSTQETRFKEGDIVEWADEGFNIAVGTKCRVLGYGREHAAEYLRVVRLDNGEILNSWYAYRYKLVSSELEVPLVGPQFKIGQYVRILEQTHGWGTVEKGDVGIVVEIDAPFVRLDIPGKQKSWNAHVHCIELVEASSVVVKDIKVGHIQMSYKNYQKEYLYLLSKDRDAQRLVLSQYFEDITAAQKRLEFINIAINSKKSKFASSGHVQEVNGLIHSLMDRYYEDFQFKAFEMVGITKPVVFVVDQPKKGINGVKVELGAFKITLNMENNSIRVEQVHGVRVDNIYEHPHVEHEKPCLGTYNMPVSEALAQANYFQVFNLMGDFIHSYEPTGWYRCVLNWLPQEEQEKYCMSCFAHKDYCECDRKDTCSECNELSENCWCAVCPLSGDRLNGGFFPDFGCDGCLHLIKDNGQDMWKCSHIRGNMATDFCDTRLTLIPGAVISAEQPTGVDHVDES